jgi:hypothetical protein
MVGRVNRDLRAATVGEYYRPGEAKNVWRGAVDKKGRALFDGEAC